MLEAGAVLAGQGLAIRLPLLLVWLIGAVAAIGWWRRHPRVSALVLAGLAGLLLASGISLAWTVSFPTLIRNGSLTQTRIGLASLAIGLTANLLGAVAWGLILTAVFVGPAPARDLDPAPDDERPARPRMRERTE